MMKLNKNKWKRVKLGEICKLEYGNTLTDKKRKGGNVPVYGSAGIVGWHDEPLTKSATLIVGRKGSIGNVFYSDIPCFPIDTTYYIQEKDCKENLYWLQIFLRHFDLRKLNMATAVPGLNRNIAYLIEIPLPPLKEQNLIASLFQSIETAIEQVKVQENNLKALRKNLINKLSKKSFHFGNLIKKLKCKEISIGEVADEIPDRIDNPSTSGFEKFVGLEDFESGELNIQKYSSTEKLVSAMKLFKSGDILFARRNAYLKRASLVDFDGVCSGDAIVMRAIKTIIEPLYLVLIMNTDEFWDFAISNAAGTMSKRVKWRDLATYIFNLPDLNTQKNILEIFQQLQTTQEQLKQQKTTLKTLKQKLLNEVLG